MRKSILISVFILAILFTTLVASAVLSDNKPADSFEDNINKEESNTVTTPNESGNNPDEQNNSGSLEQDIEANSDSEEPQVPVETKPTFEYPDAVRGIYLTGHSAGGSRFDKLLQLVDDTELNAMVIDIKDDYGRITYKLEGTPFDEYSKNYIKDPEEMLKVLAEHNIYPIARIVVFKDTAFAEKHPEYSFTRKDGSVWKNSRKEAFTNPFLKEVWEHNIEIAKIVAELGFPEIQFDYVRFPEGFEKKTYLNFSYGEYSEENLLPQIQKEWENTPLEERSAEPPQFEAGYARVTAVTDFVKYAYQELNPLGVKISVDVFGYAATRDEAAGIGQNFVKIGENVDVISSMIYPSHWGFGYFGIPKPDKEPYRLVKEYVKAEKEKFTEMSTTPISRPWIQDFTASWLKSGNYIKYGKEEVEAQIKALNEGGIKEFLIWNPTNKYSSGVDYTPEVEVEEENLSIEKEEVNQEEQSEVNDKTVREEQPQAE